MPVYELTGGADEVVHPSLQPDDATGGEGYVRYSRLELLYGEHSYQCDASTPELTLGRTSGNDVIVSGDLTSRNHARVSFREGHFTIEDCSANGTLIIPDGGESFCLNTQEYPLTGSGLICLGGTVDKNPEGLLRFTCVP